MVPTATPHRAARPVAVTPGVSFASPSTYYFAYVTFYFTGS
jgi:hypothetical protein